MRADRGVGAVGPLVDLAGWHLSDESNNPSKWAFPAGVTIPANGYLLVWADEDGLANVGLHASFKLSAAGETLYLTNANFNAIRDTVTFGSQQPDSSFGRAASSPDKFTVLLPTPGQPNP